MLQCIQVYIYTVIYANWGWMIKKGAPPKLMVNWTTNVNNHFPLEISLNGNLGLYMVIPIYPHCQTDPSPKFFVENC